MKVTSSRLSLVLTFWEMLLLWCKSQGTQSWQNTSKLFLSCCGKRKAGGGCAWPIPDTWRDHFKSKTTALWAAHFAAACTSPSFSQVDFAGEKTGLLRGEAACDPPPHQAFQTLKSARGDEEKIEKQKRNHATKEEVSPVQESRLAESSPGLSPGTPVVDPPLHSLTAVPVRAAKLCLLQRYLPSPSALGSLITQTLFHELLIGTGIYSATLGGAPIGKNWDILLVGQWISALLSDSWTNFEAGKITHVALRGAFQKRWTR